MSIIYHLTSREAWDAAQAVGEYEAPSLAEEGFIHCSADEAQTLRVAERLYAGVDGLQVLDVDTAKLRAEVKREPSRSGEIYPHIYGKINLDAVVRVRDLTLDGDGKHVITQESPMTDRALPYTSDELAKIQRAIAPAPPAPPAEFMGMLGTLPPDWMRPFWKLSDLEPDLFIRVSEDRWVMALAQYAFFPTVLEWREQGRPIPAFRTAGRTRGPVGILQSGGEQLAIKPFQNSREDEIASIAASVGAGPEQFPSLPGYLAERFADGVFFTDLPPERRDAATMHSVGRQLGGMLRRLHDAGIYYNDATLADPQGRSHLIVADGSACTLIDFGVSLLLDRHPEYTREEVRNFARTLPMYRIFAGMADNREDMDGFLAQYGRQMAQASREDIMARDLKFAQQGLAIAGQKLGQDIIPPLRDGFLEAYRPTAQGP